MQAWNSNQSEDIGRLFAEDARYYTEPFSTPWRGRQAIIEQWLARKDEPGQTRFTWRPLVVGDELAVMQGPDHPSDATAHSTLWVIRLDADGRCTECSQWWMDHPVAWRRRPESFGVRCWAATIGGL